jgi:hypothetical protein
MAKPAPAFALVSKEEKIERWNHILLHWRNRKILEIEALFFEHHGLMGWSADRYRGLQFQLDDGSLWITYVNPDSELDGPINNVSINRLLTVSDPPKFIPCKSGHFWPPPDIVVAETGRCLRDKEIIEADIIDSFLRLKVVSVSAAVFRSCILIFSRHKLPLDLSPLIISFLGSTKLEIYTLTVSAQNFRWPFNIQQVMEGELAQQNERTRNESTCTPT